MRVVVAASVAMLAAALAGAATAQDATTQLERQSWQARQDRMNPAEQREGERRLDAIDRKAHTDPRAAGDMRRIWEADRALNSLNRPGPGPMPQNPGNPSLVGPGDRN